MQQWKESERALAHARLYLAGGVSSSLRAAAKPVPLFFRAACGATVTYLDGRTYLDYALAWRIGEISCNFNPGGGGNWGLEGGSLGRWFP